MNDSAPTPLKKMSVALVMEIARGDKMAAPTVPTQLCAI